MEVRKNSWVEERTSKNMPRIGRNMGRAAFRLFLLLLASLLILVSFQPAPARAASSQVFPAVIPLPNGFQPEGIATGYGHTFYAGSLASGAIFRGDLRTGQGSLLVPPQPGRIAVGLAFDPRSGYLFVAGGTTGQAYVYDTASGATVAVYLLDEQGGFINDVVVTRTAAYFTNSFRPYIYRVPLSAAGRVPGQEAVEPIELVGDFASVPNAFNANGIDATPNGKWLMIVNTALGTLYRVDPASGYAALIDLNGGAVPDGDGILLDGRDLYVVQNALNKIAVVRLDTTLTSGEIVGVITDPDFRVPTTIAEFGHALYAVNARLNLPSPGPETEYEVVRVQKR